MPPALTNHTVCPGLGLLSCERLATPAAAAAGLCTQNTDMTEIAHGLPKNKEDKKIQSQLIGRHYLGVTRITMSSAVYSLTQVKARFSIMAVIVYSRCCSYHFISLLMCCR